MRRNGAEHRHLLGGAIKGRAIALHLLADISIGVFGATAIKFIDDHHIRKIEHIDFLQLTLGAKLRRHHIDQLVDIGHQTGVALANARGFHDD